MAHWQIDSAHSEIKFRVKHLVVSTVTGHFDRFSASIEAERDDFSDAKIQFEAETGSVNTNNPDRDKHLRSADFFDAASYPRLSFRSTRVKKIAADEYTVEGNLTIRGVTKPVALKVTYNGTVAGFGGTPVAGFEIAGKINRFDYGLQWNAMTEAGGVVVSPEVKLDIAAEFKQAEQAVKAA